MAEKQTAVRAAVSEVEGARTAAPPEKARQAAKSKMSDVKATHKLASIGFAPGATGKEHVVASINPSATGEDFDAVTEADKDRMNEAKNKAEDAFSASLDSTTKEKKWADEQVQAAGSGTDIGPYRDNVVKHHAGTVALYDRVGKLESDLDKRRSGTATRTTPLARRCSESLSRRRLPSPRRSAR